MPLPAMLAAIPGLLGSAGSALGSAGGAALGGLKGLGSAAMGGLGKAAASPFGQSFMQGSGNIAGQLFAGQMMGGDEDEELEYLKQLQQQGVPQMPTQNMASSAFGQAPAVGRRFN